MSANLFQTCNTVYVNYVCDFHIFIYSPKHNCSKEQNITTMQMELNYDLDPSEQEREGDKRRKSECLCLFSALRNSGAWELQQLGRALRNILSCNVNMSELWSSKALPSPSQFNPVFCAKGFASDIRSPLSHFLSGVMTLRRIGCLKSCK